MAKGQERRKTPEDNLEGKFAITPETNRLPNLQGARVPQVKEDTFGSQIAQQVQGFASERLARIQKERQERSLMDGAIAQMQGESFDNVKMGGDKWALEGYRIIQAQALSSGLLQSSLEKIREEDYEQDPDTYRETINNRLEQMTAGIDDPDVKRMALEDLTKGMPELVNEHMKAHLAFLEQQNFDSVSSGINIFSKDPSRIEEFNALFNGKTGVADGLSEERRKEAITQGIIASFLDNNFLAFAKASEYINQDNFSINQIRRIRAARVEFETRAKTYINEEYRQKFRDLQHQVENGELSGPEAVKQEAILLADLHIRMTTAGSNAIYESARENNDLARQSRGTNFKAFVENRDFISAASVLLSSIINVESSGNTDAISKKGAVGLMQIMPETAKKPGLGVLNVFEVAKALGVPVEKNDDATVRNLLRNPEVNRVLGANYLAALINRYDGNLEKIFIAYNAGMKVADNWKGNPGNLPEETQKYLAKLMPEFTGNSPDATTQLSIAQDHLDRVRAKNWDRAQPALQAALVEFRTGVISLPEYISKRNAIYKEYYLQVEKGRSSTWGKNLTSTMEERFLNPEYTFSKAAKAASVRNTAFNALTSGTGGTLTGETLDTATKLVYDRADQLATQVAAKNPDVSESQIQALRLNMLAKEFARNGMVDERLQQQVNLAASGKNWVNAEGQPNPQVALGLQTFAALYREDPNTALDYVSEEDAGRMLAAIAQIQGFSGRSLIETMDLTNPDDPMTSAIHQTIALMGPEVSKPPDPDRDERIIKGVLGSVRSGNLTGNWFGGLLNWDASGAVSARNLVVVDGEIGLAVTDLSGLPDKYFRFFGGDRAAFNKSFSYQAEQIARKIVPYLPESEKNNAIKFVLQIMQARGAWIGNSFVMASPGDPPITSQMFPGQQVKDPNIATAAIMGYIQSPEAHAKYPSLVNMPTSKKISSDSETMFLSPIPFSVTNMNGNFFAHIKGFGSIVLNFKEIGDWYLDQQ